MKRLLSIAVLVIALAFGGTIASQADIIKLDQDTILLTDELLLPDGRSFYDIATNMIVDGVTDIQFLINTEGGHADAMYLIVETMKEIQGRGYTITTVNIGEAASAGAYIWIHGDVRQATPEARYMFHSTVIFNGIGIVPFRLLPEKML